MDSHEVIQQSLDSRSFTGQVNWCELNSQRKDCEPAIAALHIHSDAAL